jgi:hypothetical protein
LPLNIIQLVNADLATTSNPTQETLLGLLYDHSGLCSLGEPGSESLRQVEDWVQFIFSKDCRKDVERKIELCMFSFDGAIHLCIKLIKI